jgi:hypothetical protein
MAVRSPWTAAEEVVRSAPEGLGATRARATGSARRDLGRRINAKLLLETCDEHFCSAIVGGFFDVGERLRVL